MNAAEIAALASAKTCVSQGLVAYHPDMNFGFIVRFDVLEIITSANECVENDRFFTLYATNEFDERVCVRISFDVPGIFVHGVGDVR